MKIFLLLVLVFFSGLNILQAQELKKIKKDTPEKYFVTKETYYVLKDDEQIKHGLYKKVVGRSVLTGQYDHDRRKGIWKAYDESKCIQEINFDTGEVRTANAGKSFSKVFILSADGQSETESELEPILVGGYPLFFSIISKNLKLSPQFIANNKNNSAVVSAVITKDGKMMDRKIIQAVGFGMDEKIMELFNKLPDDWLPISINDVPVDVRIEFKLDFTFRP